ncbi:MAG TPA: FHA domain-containing protein [Solirubrobacteraceae bacterium]
MIVGSKRSQSHGVAPQRHAKNKEHSMESLVSGTLAGAGSFRCESCGYVTTLSGTESLGPCPSCGGRQFARASLFAAGRFERDQTGRDPEHEVLATAARAELPGPGRFVAFRDGDALRVIALEREHTRIGRSLSADIRFDDQTVSRRHALLVMAADEVRVLDDRSLNGVFVNGERIEIRALKDGDEVVIGRHRLCYLEAVDTRAQVDEQLLRTT